LCGANNKYEVTKLLPGSFAAKLFAEADQTVTGFTGTLHIFDYWLPLGNNREESAEK
jgi:hypothetical protein